jgi:AmpE protein
VNLLALLVALLLDQGLRHLETHRERAIGMRILRRLRRYVAARREHALALLVLLVLLPVVLADLLERGLAALSPVPAFLFAVAVLLLTFGPRDASHLVRRYVDALGRHDDVEAHRAARLLIEEAPPSDARGCCDAVAEHLLARVNERLFAPIFWFVILGPAGAVLFWAARSLRAAYRPGTADAASDVLAEAARRIYGVLAWAPACLLALSYALVGGFDTGWDAFRAHDLGRMLLAEDGTERMLRTVGCAALAPTLPAGTQGPDRVLAARRLVHRALFLWLAVLAVFTLGGWLF